MANWEIRRHYPGSNVSLQISTAAKRGQAVQITSSDPTKGELCGSNGSFAGFLTRNVTADGPSLADHVYPGRIELDATIGDTVSLERADAFEAEGSDYLYSGTGALTSGSTIGTELSFVNGKIRAVQSGETAYYKLAAVLTAETAGNLRILAEAIR